MASEFTYRGHDVRLYREENAKADRTGMPHEFYAEIDGQRVMSATTLERGQHDIDYEDIPNWTWALERYARAYIDGQIGWEL